MSASRRLSLGGLLAFSSPGIPTGLLISPVFGILPSYYALHTRVTLAEVGSAFLIARIIDAFIDPMVGILSDRTRSLLGSRLPWMIGGGVLALPSAYYFFLPPRTAGSGYFFVTSFLTMVAWTALTIPHSAWAAELSADYDERTRIFGVKNVIAYVGVLAFYLLPLAVAPLTGTTEINAATMMGLVAALCVLTPTTLAWAGVRSPLHGEGAELTAVAPASFAGALRSVIGNRPFQWFVMITLFAGIAVGMNGSLLYLYVQDYLDLGRYYYLIGFIPGVISVVVIPGWLWLSRRADKSTVWAGGLLVGAIVTLPILLLKPGVGAFIPLLTIVSVGAVTQGAAILMPSSVLADVADYAAWKQKTKVTGNYFALLMLLSKVTAAVGSSLALIVSGALGYVTHAQGGRDHVMALMIPFVIIPTVLTLFAVVLIYRFPLTRQRHALIKNRLEKREARLAQVVQL